MSNQSGWSDWIWAPEGDRAYRARLGENGEYQYQYSDDPTAPRGDDSGLANALQTLHVDDPQDDANDGSYATGMTASSDYHQQRDYPHYGTSAAQPSSTAKSKGKHVDTGSKSSKRNPQTTKASSSKHKSRHKTKGSSHQGQHAGGQFEPEDDLDPYNPFYESGAPTAGKPHMDNVPISEHGRFAREREAGAAPEDPDVELEQEYEPEIDSEPEGEDEDERYGYGHPSSRGGYRDPTTYKPAADGGYGQSQERQPQRDAYSSSKHSKHSKSSGKRKKEKGYQHGDHMAAGHEELDPRDLDPALQTAVEESHGYGTGHPSAFAAHRSAFPAPVSYHDDDEEEEDEEGEEDQQLTPTRPRSPADFEPQYTGEQYGSDPYSNYASQSGYETGQARSRATYPDGAYTLPQEDDYSLPHESSYQPGRDDHSGSSYSGIFSAHGTTVMDINAAGLGEQLDNRYSIQPSSKFAPGEVFKVLWPEPLGAGRDAKASVGAPTEVEVHNNHLGQKIYVGFRRFIVVANDEGHCTCVPILTYGRRGCTKRGLKPQKHGIVYAEGARPITLPNEPTLGYPPVQLQPYFSTEKLALESRVNYSKLTTVEHNVKVFFIGHIVRSDFDIVEQAVEECWSAKARRAGESSSRRHHRRK